MFCYVFGADLESFRVFHGVMRVLSVLDFFDRRRKKEIRGGSEACLDPEGQGQHSLVCLC